MKSVKQMFTYGTLMSNERNHHYFKDAILKIEPAIIQGKLIHLSKYNCPTLESGLETVVGELITYEDNNDEIEKRIVALEQDFDGLYYHQKSMSITVNNKQFNQLVFIYQVNNNDQIEYLNQVKWSEQKD